MPAKDRVISLEELGQHPDALQAFKDWEEKRSASREFSLAQRALKASTATLRMALINARLLEGSSWDFEEHLADDGLWDLSVRPKEEKPKPKPKRAEEAKSLPSPAKTRGRQTTKRATPKKRGR